MRPFAFNFDAEGIHEWAMRAIRQGLFKARSYHDDRLEQEFFGVKMPNPLGLAAGFDKNAIALDHWKALGFGSVECGTITFHPQPGNPRPRLFRLPEDGGLVNRMGFNNEGARTIATRLAEARPGIPVGVNLGKSKITDLEKAAEDYANSFQLLHTFGDYFVVNVSSPNTPGLRSLQDEKPLREILTAMRAIDSSRALFIKLAPDLEPEAIDHIAGLVEEFDLAGLVATNTTISRQGLSADPKQDGGLSGLPLKKRSNGVLAQLYRSCSKSRILIGVGGIFDGDDLYEKISLGANFCQVYTGWIYGGPHMVPDCLEKLVARMERESIPSLAALRGSAAHSYSLT